MGKPTTQDEQRKEDQDLWEWNVRLLAPKINEQRNRDGEVGGEDQEVRNDVRPPMETGEVTTFPPRREAGSIEEISQHIHFGYS